MLDYERLMDRAEEKLIPEVVEHMYKLGGILHGDLSREVIAIANFLTSLPPEYEILLGCTDLVPYSIIRQGWVDALTVPYFHRSGPLVGVFVVFCGTIPVMYEYGAAIGDMYFRTVIAHELVHVHDVYKRIPTLTSEDRAETIERELASHYPRTFLTRTAKSKINPPLFRELRERGKVEYTSDLLDWLRNIKLLLRPYEPPAIKPAPPPKPKPPELIPPPTGKIPVEELIAVLKEDYAKAIEEGNFTTASLLDNLISKIQRREKEEVKEILHALLEQGYSNERVKTVSESLLGDHALLVPSRTSLSRQRP